MNEDLRSRATELLKVIDEINELEIQKEELEAKIDQLDIYRGHRGRLLLEEILKLDRNTNTEIEKKSS